jgi:multicomponent Na+:H+ antiporter subunit D
MEQPSVLPGLSLAPAALAAGLIVLCRRRPNLRETWSVLAALAQTAAAALMVPAALRGVVPTWAPVALAPGVPLELRADPPGLLFALVASGLWVVTTVYSIGYMRALAEPLQTRYYACFALCLLATLGVAFAGNLLTFVLFFELLTVATYPLVVHKGSEEAVRAGRVYLAYTLSAGAALLGAVAWTAGLTGRLEFVPGGLLGGAEIPRPVLWTLLGLFVVGCGVKAAVVPLHTWLPLAMVAPTPVSALLHAVAVVKAGVFGLVRVVGYVFGPERLAELGAADLLLGLAVTTILFGSLVALVEDNLKRLLAFSTVSQLSYVVLGLAVGSSDALAGGLLHIASHALLKITLFFCAGALYVSAHVERVSELDGLGFRMPFTLGAFAVAAVLLTGLPPGAAFASKWRLVHGAASAGAWPAVGALLVSTLLNAAYFLPIVLRAFARRPGGGVREAPLSLLVPLLLTCAAGLALGLFPDAPAPLLRLAEATALGVRGGP